MFPVGDSSEVEHPAVNRQVDGSNPSPPANKREWTILLEMPPVAKARARVNSKGWAYTPKKTMEFEESAKKLMRAQFILQPLETPVSVHIDFVFNRPAKPKHHFWHIVRPDLDNLLKAVGDAGNGLLWSDDSQICQLSTRKFYAMAPVTPRIILTVTSIDNM